MTYRARQRRRLAVHGHDGGADVRFVDAWAVTLELAACIVGQGARWVYALL